MSDDYVSPPFEHVRTVKATIRRPKIEPDNPPWLHVAEWCTEAAFVLLSFPVTALLWLMGDVVDD